MSLALYKFKNHSIALKTSENDSYFKFRKATVTDICDLTDYNCTFGIISLQACANQNVKITVYHSNWYQTSDIIGTESWTEFKTIDLVANQTFCELLDLPVCKFIKLKVESTSDEVVKAGIYLVMA